MSAAHVAAAVYNNINKPAMATNDDSRPPSPSALPPIPASPTYSYASTALPIPSAFNLPLPPPPQSAHSVLKKSDIEASQTAYSELLSSAKAYRLALAELSSSASTFGSALEACARLKEARSPSIQSSENMSNSFTSHGNSSSSSCTANGLLAASGVHQLIANHQQILSETVYRSFEVPLLHDLDQWRSRMDDEEERYQKDAKGMSREIRKMEKEGLRLHGKRKRDVGAFREHLVKLTLQLDGLTSLHGGHARGLLREGQEMSLSIVECSAGLVRAEVDIFEALARKGWSGGGLDELLERGRDLFANETDTNDSHHSKIFSILPNKSILADTVPEHATRPLLADQRHNHARTDSLLVEGHGYQSLTAAILPGIDAKDADVRSVISDYGMVGNNRDATTGILNRSRGARPFSPPPRERVPIRDDPLDLPKPLDLVIPVVDTDCGVCEDDDSKPEVNDESLSKDVKDPSSKNIHGKRRVATDGIVGTPVKDRERRWSVTDGALSD